MYWLFSVPGDFQGSLSVPPVLQHKMYFLYSVTNSSLKNVWPFVWRNLNPLHPRMLCAKFDRYRPLDFKENDKNVKCYDKVNKNNNLITMENGNISIHQIRKAHLSFNFSSGELIIKFNQTDWHILRQTYKDRNTDIHLSTYIAVHKQSILLYTIIFSSYIKAIQ